MHVTFNRDYCPLEKVEKKSITASLQLSSLGNWETIKSLCFSTSGYSATVGVLLLYQLGSFPSMDRFFKEFTNYIEIITPYKSQVIVAAGLNILVKMDGMQAIQLCNMLSTFGCKQNTPHSQTHHDGGTLDLTITKSEQLLDHESVQLYSIISGHSDFLVATTIIPTANHWAVGDQK